MSNNFRDFINKATTQQAWIVMLLGIIAILASAFYTQTMQPKPAELSWVFAEGLSTIATAFIGFGFFGLLLDTKGWQAYFSERLKQIVIEKDYLKSLDAATLQELQVSALKAQFKNPNIDKEGSFLNYFQNHLHKFISEPYREDVSTEVIMEPHNNGFKVYDKVNYICRASNGVIQEFIRWRPDENEFESVDSIVIKVKKQNENDYSEIYNSATQAAPPNLMRGIEVKLDDYKNDDGLRVTIESKYVVKHGKFQYWQMSHPTKNFDIMIKYPDDCDIQFKTLFVDDIDKVETINSGYLKLKYNSWLIPQSGIAWLLTKRA